MFALPWGQNYYPEDYKFHNFSKGLLALHHHAFSFSTTCVVVEKKIIENWSILGSFCPAPKAPGGQRPWNSQPLFPFTHRCYKPNLVEIGSAVLEKKLKMFKSLRPTNDERRRTKTDSNRSPEWLRWPKNQYDESCKTWPPCFITSGNFSLESF
jgi:hypothetical protein